MKSVTQASEVLASKTDAAIGLKAAAQVLLRWGASGAASEAILRVSRSVLSKARNQSLDEIKLDRDQLARLSLVLNMHAALRTVFENQENVTGFMAMANSNPWFNGQQPLQVIAGGDFAALYETSKRIDALRGAQW